MDMHIGASVAHERRKLEAVADAHAAHERAARAERVAREARDRAIHAAVRAGVSYAEISRTTGLSVARVSHIANASNVS
ncbi:hypothetical protein GCM10009584_14310 [Ornithinimicrobium humiphilum]|uniref:Sigma-70-like protein n=1 Tax=Ornithinimicrobium humiphilum TaxID=125288 RepID=A0A543KKE8_9MICO|nr:hypothetical protein [Ornithinimicrobium humiphilum]TQM95524.1 hypothetical protein FB476_0368 [Ornithinimicrobium humiphilum]